MNFPKRDASSLCFFILFFLVCLKVFEEQLVLSLDDDDDGEEYPSLLSGKSSLPFSLLIYQGHSVYLSIYLLNTIGTHPSIFNIMAIILWHLASIAG